MESKHLQVDYLIMPGGKIPIPSWHPAYRAPSMSLPGRRADRIRDADLFDPPA